MGYSTDFQGKFQVTPPLNKSEVEYLTAFACTSRMQRSALKLKNVPDPKREAVGLPLGEDACYFVGHEDNFGQDETPDIVDYNHPPKGQPCLWCQWVPSESGTLLAWDGNEKFYHYVEWLEYLVKHFLNPWGHKLNGEVEWHGDDRNDIGKIIVKDNEVTTKQGKITFAD